MSTKPYQIVIICPTWMCNCRCQYCYQKHEPLMMSDETVSIVQKFIENNILLLPNYFWLEFFGGEPLLCLDNILKLSKYTKEVCISNNIYFMGSITTNGVLITRSTLEKLCNAGITQFQITLDGTPNFHNIQRNFISGKGTWEKIWNALLCFKESSSQFKVIIRIHYNIFHLHEAVSLITNYINPNFSKDERFLIRFEEVKSFNNPILRNFSIYNSEEKPTAVEQLKDAIINPQMIAPITDNYVCYATRPYSIVVTPEGDVTNCTVSLRKIGVLEPDGCIEFFSQVVPIVCSTMQRFCQQA